VTRTPPVPAADDAESLFEDAPCGYLTTRPNGEVVRVNATFLRWTGYPREQIVGSSFASLLGRGGQIFHETHYAPLLQLQGSVSEIAFEIRRADGTMLPVLVNATIERDPAGTPLLIRTAVFDVRQRRAYERELVRMRDDDRHVARVLQESLLAHDPPEDDRVEIASSYLPAVDGLNVGGDWHDAFETAPGRISLVVGDIVGKGLAAASAMGRLRSAVRAYAVTGQSPASLLSRLDAFVAIDPPTRFATVAYLELDVSSGVVAIASAGHPPALLIDPDGEAQLLWQGRSAPLGAYPEPFERPDDRFQLLPGARLFLYTDGLVERRGEPLDLGFARLADAAGRTEGGSLAAQVHEIVRTLTASETMRDDVCVLAIRR
jgi:phosphoserine phosphatase RsbU/P